jgi:hypothetical protein
MRARSTVPDAERRALGRRWSLGIASLFFGALAGGAVLCLHFPELLTTGPYPVHRVDGAQLRAGAFPAQLVWPFARD